MKRIFEQKNIATLAFCGMLLVFIISKISFLYLPYYWDEAWSYAVAVLDLNQHGISLIPGHVDTEFTRGHPLLYYATAACWLRVFGSSLVSAHTFALLVSCASLYAVFVLCRKQLNSAIALIVSTLLAFNPWFWVQSTFLLPEIFLMLFSVLSIHAYFSKKWMLFLVWASCMVLTKETGWVLMIMFFFDHVVLSLLFKQSKFDKEYFKKTLFLMIPSFVIIAFLGIQHLQLGWFFFPGHIGLIHASLQEVTNQTQLILELLFVEKQQIYFTIAGLLALVLIIKKKITISPLFRFNVFLVCFILAYIAFSSINFFTVRYLLCVVPFLLIITWSLISQLKTSVFGITAIVSAMMLLVIVPHCTAVSGIVLVFLGVLLIVSLHFNYRFNIAFFSIAALLCLYQLNEIRKNSSESDVSIGYQKACQAHQQAIQYCEKNQWQDKSIQTGFLLAYDFTHPQLGYISDTTRSFTQINKGNPSVYVFTSCDYNIISLIDSLKCDSSFSNIRFGNESSWVALFYKTNLARN